MKGLLPLAPSLIGLWPPATEKGGEGKEGWGCEEGVGELRRAGGRRGLGGEEGSPGPHADTEPRRRAAASPPRDARMLGESQAASSWQRRHLPLGCGRNNNSRAVQKVNM